MEKYMKHFLKNRFLMVFGYSSLFYPMFFLLFVTDESVWKSLLFGLIVYIPGLIWYAVDVVLVIRFKRLIQDQEQRFGVAFEDKNAAAVAPKSDTFLSDDWLIFAGKYAFFRGYIKQISIISKRTAWGRAYVVKIYSADGKVYPRGVDSVFSAQKIQQWLHQ